MKGKRRGAEKKMERKRWRALTLLFVAFLFRNAVPSAHSSVAAAAVVYRGSSCTGSNVKCQAEDEEAEFHFGSEIQWGFLEAPANVLTYGALGPQPICNPVNGQSYASCLGAVNKYQPPPCPMRMYYRC